MDNFYGYKSKNIMVVPIKDLGENNILGVLTATNK